MPAVRSTATSRNGILPPTKISLRQRPPGTAPHAFAEKGRGEHPLKQPMVDLFPSECQPLSVLQLLARPPQKLRNKWSSLPGRAAVSPSQKASCTAASPPSTAPCKIVPLSLPTQPFPLNPQESQAGKLLSMWVAPRRASKQPPPPRWGVQSPPCFHLPLQGSADAA